MNTCNLNSDTLYLQYFLKNEMGNTWQILAALWLQSNGTNWIAQFFELNVPSPINRNKLVPYQKKKKIMDWIWWESSWSRWRKKHILHKQSPRKQSPIENPKIHNLFIIIFIYVSFYCFTQILHDVSKRRPNIMNLWSASIVSLNLTFSQISLSTTYNDLFLFPSSVRKKNNYSVFILWKQNNTNTVF
jgi:hypothetical protein